MVNALFLGHTSFQNGCLATRAVCTSVKDGTAWLFANSSLMSNVQYHNDDFFLKLKLTEKTGKIIN